MTMLTILIHDGNQAHCQRLAADPSQEERRVLTARDADELIRQLCSSAPDLILIGHIPGQGLLDLLARIRLYDSDSPVLGIFAPERMKEMAPFLRNGGDGCLVSPVDADLFSLTVERLGLRQQQARELAWLRIAHSQAAPPALIGESRQTRSLRSFIDSAGAEDGPVLIAGEKGAGKALAAQLIHLHSPRAQGPFLRFNCSAAADRDLDVELFGSDGSDGGTIHRKGIFELARGGTVLLEDIDTLAILQQERLAGIMAAGCYCRRDGQQRLPFQVRVIAATSRDPETLLERGELEPSLYGLLQGSTLFIPPLRERTEDILPLVFHFMERYNHEFGRNIGGLSKLVERLLLEYPWPGNIREMRNVMERAVILGGADLLYLEHLPLELFAKAGPVSPASFTCRLPSSGVDIDEVEKELIRQALEVTNGNQSRAARKLNLGIDAFRYRMKKFGFLK
jgi:DNA-binding NtrC family response regulator